MKIFPFKKYILFEDENLIAINKPAFVSSLEDRGQSGISIQQMAEQYFEDSSLCHRLDKETSGILLIAKNQETYREISIKFQNRQMEKTYLAIVSGRHYFQNHLVDIPLGQTARGKAKVDHRNGKESETVINALETFRNFTFVECLPTTGRLHQIRIHCALQNAPLAGDTSYGGSKPFLSQIKRNFNLSKNQEPRPMIHRSALHARNISFMYNDDKITFEAPLPKDMEVFLTLLRKYDLS
jgi:23S rRNA pseudouridine955/2504/2580 synthase